MGQPHRTQDGALLGTRHEGAFRHNSRQTTKTTGGFSPTSPGSNFSFDGQDRLTNISSQWALVIAGIADFARPAEKLSLTQNAALTATGTIWTRWCLIIKPKNYLLAAVNFFLAGVGIVQCTRILLWQQSQKNSLPAVAADIKEDVKEAVKA